MKKSAKVAATGMATACVVATACYCWNFRMPPKEYTSYALYMATLDDEICRNELDGNTIQGEPIVFPPKEESLQYRYHLFLGMNRKKSRKDIQAEIKQMQQRSSFYSIFPQVNLIQLPAYRRYS